MSKCMYIMHTYGYLCVGISHIRVYMYFMYMCAISFYVFVCGFSSRYLNLEAAELHT